MDWRSELYYAIMSARNIGVSPDDFRIETIAAWKQVLEKEAANVEKVFNG